EAPLTSHKHRTIGINLRPKVHRRKRRVRPQNRLARANPARAQTIRAAAIAAAITAQITTAIAAQIQGTAAVQVTTMAIAARVEDPRTILLNHVTRTMKRVTRANG